MHFDDADDDDFEDGFESAVVFENDIDWESLVWALGPTHGIVEGPTQGAVGGGSFGTAAAFGIDTHEFREAAVPDVAFADTRSIDVTSAPMSAAHDMTGLGVFEAIPPMYPGIIGVDDCKDRAVAPSTAEPHPQPTNKSRKTKRALQEEDDETKMQRTGSLGRIIVSGTAVNHPGTKKGGQSHSDKTPAPYKAGVACSRIVNAFNASDLDMLSKMIRDQCLRDCSLYSNALPMPLRGRHNVMMFLALQMETYPDGIWVCTKSQVTGMVITRDYTFSGTRVFLKPTHELMAHVRAQSEMVMRMDPAQRSTLEIDVISSILESCYITPEIEAKAGSTLAAGEAGGAGSSQKAAAGGGKGRGKSGGAALSEVISAEPGRAQNKLYATFSSANVMALALREQRNVVNVERRICFTFDSLNRIVRIDSFGDL